MFNTENATPMLAKDFKKDSHLLKWSEGVVSQPKLDGVRALCGIKDNKFFLKSREINIITILIILKMHLSNCISQKD